MFAYLDLTALAPSLRTMTLRIRPRSRSCENRCVRPPEHSHKDKTHIQMNKVHMIAFKSIELVDIRFINTRMHILKLSITSKQTQNSHSNGKSPPDFSQKHQACGYILEYTNTRAPEQSMTSRVKQGLHSDEKMSS